MIPAERGRIYGVYTSDNFLQFKTLVDRDRFLVMDFNWTPVETPLVKMPRGFRPRHVVGISSTSQRRARATVPNIEADIWTGVATTWDIEATDGTIDTMTVTARVQEHPLLP